MAVLRVRPAAAACLLCCWAARHSHLNCYPDCVSLFLLINRVNAYCSHHAPLHGLPHTGLMRSAEAVLTAKTNERLEQLIPRLNKVSGLPVVDEDGRVIGVVSRKVRQPPASGRCCAHHPTALYAPVLCGMMSPMRCSAQSLLTAPLTGLPVIIAIIIVH